MQRVPDDLLDSIVARGNDLLDRFGMTEEQFSQMIATTRLDTVEEQAWMLYQMARDIQDLKS